MKSGIASRIAAMTQNQSSTCIRITRAHSAQLIKSGIRHERVVPHNIVNNAHDRSDDEEQHHNDARGDIARDDSALAQIEHRKRDDDDEHQTPEPEHRVRKRSGISVEMFEVIGNESMHQRDRLEDNDHPRANASTHGSRRPRRTHCAGVQGGRAIAIGGRRHHHGSTRRRRQRRSSRRFPARLRHARRCREGIIGESHRLPSTMSMGPRDRSPHHSNDAPGQAGRQLMMETLPIHLFPQTTDGRAPGPLTTCE